MAFVRYKDVGGGRKYYQVVRNYREMGRHRQEVLYHLGKHSTLEEAIRAKRREETWHQNQAARYYKKAAGLRAKILHNRRERFGNEVPSREEARTIKKKALELYDEAKASEDSHFVLRKAWLEEQLAKDILEYHFEQTFASLYSRGADKVQTEIDELLDLKQKYQL